MKVRILILVGLLVIFSAAALPAFANHQWTETSASCDSNSHTVTFFSTNEGGDAPGYWVDFYADGNFLEEVAYYTDDPPFPDAGQYQFTYTNDAFTNGVVVTFEDITVTCAPGRSDACPNPTPDGFVVRNIPAGALAYFAASPDTYAGFNLPPGTWETGPADNGFVEVWIACQANNIFVPAENVVG